MIKPPFRQVLHLAAILTATLGPQAATASACASRDSVVTRLASDYAEQLTVGGLQKVGDGHTVMEIWASPETGTFTVLMTNAHGVSCIVAAGTDFFETTPEKTRPGTPS